MALLLRQLLRMEQPGARDRGRLALVAGTTLAFVTVAIPLQLHRQWITIGWALEGAALAWLFRRIRHNGLLYWTLGLLGAVFVRLALNPEILQYEPRGSMRILNWYLYAYWSAAAAFLLAARWLSQSEDGVSTDARTWSSVLSGAAVILLFLLLNIEIADFYATGPTIMFRFGVTVSQDLTYTIGWLMFGMVLLAACIYMHSRFGRVASLVLIALTTFKCFLYDLGSLEGLYRVGSFVGLRCRWRSCRLHCRGSSSRSLRVRHDQSGSDGSPHRFAVSMVSSQQAELGAPLNPALFAFRRTIPDGGPGAVALIVDRLGART